MTRLAGILLVCIGMTGCATTTDMAGLPSTGGLATSAFDYAPSRGERGAVDGFGYEMLGEAGWSARLSYEASAGEPDVVMMYDIGAGESQAELAISMPYLADGVRRFHGTGPTGDPIAVEMQAGPCETAAGDVQTYFVDLRMGDRQFSGCAREVSRQDRWSNYLVTYLPAIDACLAEMQTSAQHVSVAYTLPGGETGVRLVDREMRTWECATREEGRAMNSLRQLDAADAVYGEGDPIFVRSAYPEFGEGCYVYETVRAMDGALIGSFGHDACTTGPVAAAGPDVG